MKKVHKYKCRPAPLVATTSHVLAWAYWERCHDLAGPVRWWRSEWPGDTFDIISEEELQKRLAACEVLVLAVREGLPCNEEGE